MMEKKKITFILNPISGTHSKEEIPNLIEQTLDQELYDYTIRFTEYAGHAAEIAKECVELEEDVVGLEWTRTTDLALIRRTL